MFQRRLSTNSSNGRGAVVVSWLAFAGMILVTSAGLFGAYAVGFYDGVKDGERLASRPSAAAR
jgi:hypothetical protein